MKLLLDFLGKTVKSSLTVLDPWKRRGIKIMDDLGMLSQAI